MKKEISRMCISRTPGVPMKDTFIINDELTIRLERYGIRDIRVHITGPRSYKVLRAELEDHEVTRETR